MDAEVKYKRTGDYEVTVITVRGEEVYRQKLLLCPPSMGKAGRREGTLIPESQERKRVREALTGLFN